MKIQKTMSKEKNKSPKTNLANVLLLSASVGLFIIGVHQMITLGFMHSYWIFMLSVVMLFIYQLRKKQK